MAWHAVEGPVQFDAIDWCWPAGLDIGCGASKILPHMVGVDSEEYYPKDDPEPKRSDLQVTTCERLPIFSDEAFETIFSSHLLDCIPDPRAALVEWWRVLKKDRHLVLHLCTDAINSLGTRPGRKHQLTREKLMELIRTLPSYDIVHSEDRDDKTCLVVLKKTTEGRRESWREPIRDKRVAIVRPGAHGDALWAGSVAAALKAEGYHVTMYQSIEGRGVLENDPAIDRIFCLMQPWFGHMKWQAFYKHLAKKYDRFVNLIWSAETTLLPHVWDIPFGWPDELRHQHMNHNYLEFAHRVAGVPMRFRQRFYPSLDEEGWARNLRLNKWRGPMVLVAPTGSNETKAWPYTQHILDECAKRKIHCVVTGEIHQNYRISEEYGHIFGMGLPLRNVMALALQADVVVGVETSILNAVAMAPNLKIVILSHSSVENLTKHWTNTVSMTSTVACHPCHRIHADFEFCFKDEKTNSARCQASVSGPSVFALIEQYLDTRQQRVA